MRFALDIEPDSGVAQGTFAGEWDFREAERALRETWESAGWNGRGAVFDMRQVRFDVTSEETEAFARFILDHQPYPPPLRVAFVSDGDLQYGTMRMFEVYREHPRTRTRVTRDIVEALDWARGA